MTRLHVRSFPVLLTNLWTQTWNDRQTFLKQAGIVRSRKRKMKHTQLSVSVGMDAKHALMPIPTAG